MSSSVFDLVHAVSSNPSVASPSFHRIYRISCSKQGAARAKAGVALSEKYGVPQDGSQTVVAITNKVTGEQTWYNLQRSKKPQTFKPDENTVVDPFTHPETQCDFCQWQELTAEDTFGRFETDLVVTASNLFKYCHPCHGLALFKHHDPLHFTEQHIHDLLLVSQQWLQAAQQQHPEARFPAFIWNCLARAGASQFHGHAQLMLSQEPLPSVHTWQHAWDEKVPGSVGRYWHELVSAHASVNLLTTLDTDGEQRGDRVFLFPSLTPVKDQEVVILGSGMKCSSFASAVHGALRTLIDDLGSQTFNVVIFGMNTETEMDECQSTRKNVGAVLKICSHLEPEQGRCEHEDLRIVNPVVARVVVRGAVSAKASDFGAVEVLCGASIGRTDPYIIHEKLQRRFSQQL